MPMGVFFLREETYDIAHAVSKITVFTMSVQTKRHGIILAFSELDLLTQGQVDMG